MKLKVCGMLHPENMQELAEVSPDYMGLIFYPPSPRHVGDKLDPKRIPHAVKAKRVGVFVDAELDYVKDQINAYTLSGVQLHGKEAPEYCQALRSEEVEVIKAFSVGKEAFDFDQTIPYLPGVDFFLFDTKGKLPGGNGVSFRWELLDQYDLDKPFFLSGGISLNHMERLRAFQHPKLHAIDINSKFEIEPGLKDINKVKELWNAIH